MACVCSSAQHGSSHYSLASGAVVTMQLLMLLACAQPAHLLEWFLASLANNHRKKLRWKAPLEISISTPVEGKKIVSPIGMSLFSSLGKLSCVLQGESGAIFPIPPVPPQRGYNLIPTWDPALLQPVSKIYNLGKSNGGTEQLSLRSAKLGFQCTKIQAKDFFSVNPRCSKQSDSKGADPGLCFNCTDV